MVPDGRKLEEVAYYYPEPHWLPEDGSWVKSLLLFFDSVAMLLPKYMSRGVQEVDPSLLLPLQERGLLHVLYPEEFLDREVIEKLGMAVVDFITSGVFDHLTPSSNFAPLSRSRLGWDADIELSKMVIDELVSRGLAREGGDRQSVRLHEDVRLTVLVLLSQLVRDAGRRRGLDLNPTTNQIERVYHLLAVLNAPQVPTKGSIVTLDLESVALDLESVPLDDVLQFRAEHAKEYRTYARELRRFLVQLSLASTEERKVLLIDRREELADRADDLRRLARKSWRLPLARFSVGAAGAAWNIIRGDVPGAMAALGSSLLELDIEDRSVATAYSYLFAVEESFSRR